MPYDLYSFDAGDPPFEHLYDLPAVNAFKAVNGAVFYVLTRLVPGQPLSYSTVDGGAVYNLEGRGLWSAQIYVLYVADTVAALRIHPIMPMDVQAREVWSTAIGPIARADLRYVLELCHGAIVSQLRRAAIILGSAPEPPPASDIERVFTWQQIYYPDITDRALSAKTGIPIQTIKNKRSKLGTLKRVPRKLEGE